MPMAAESSVLVDLDRAGEWQGSGDHDATAVGDGVNFPKSAVFIFHTLVVMVDLWGESG